ncbi:hypothetical protein EDD41_0590 [Luteococcus japonicus]|uniref:Uncharacterized protein n=1 Tax=Luteococcus japonicus TaxID=33984 RepID=A0A3N1ZRU7_9ACTN|nr:hypothetical protein [Luteococcus japonicus]ROR53438.1 hypothetical protein EDD41_0587 [Luteococcus japonicus]ROR53441.1 hypothetical protein EDD41_0590 [Luteococcus japonicus]
MLFLVSPPLSIYWTDSPLARLQIIKDHPNVIEELEWKAVEEPHDPHRDLDLALRHGIPVRSGIVVDAAPILDGMRPGQLRQSLSDMNASQARLHESKGFQQAEDLIEQAAPGWKAHGEHLDREVDRATQASIAEAEEEAAQWLKQERQPLLMDHWRSVGGWI